MVRRHQGILLTGLAFLGGCCGKREAPPVLFGDFPPERPFVAGVNGLLSRTVETTLEKLSKRHRFPYAVVDVGEWPKLLPLVQKTHAQGRPQIFIGSSAGCRDIELLAKACKKDNIDVSCVMYANAFYTSFGPPDISSNVAYFHPYMSKEQGIFDGNSSSYNGLSNGRTVFVPIDFVDAPHSFVVCDTTFTENLIPFLYGKGAPARGTVKE